MGEAIALVRETLGPDAIIVSDQQEEGGIGVRVTAAIDTPIDALGAIPSVPDALDKLTDALTHHAVPAGLSERILAVAARAQMGTADAAQSLAEGLERCFYFAPIGLPAAGARPIMLVGPPAAGRTLAAAKLAQRAAGAKRHVTLIAAGEGMHDGAADGLSRHARKLGVEMMMAEGAVEIARALALCEGMAVIDCAGVNPFERAAMDALKETIGAADGEPVLVMPAGGDPWECADMAAEFAAVGVRRLIATRGDIARRLGGILSAAEAGGLALAEIGWSAAVAGGLDAFDALGLARRLLPRRRETAAPETTAQETTILEADTVRQWKQAVAS
jgi:flagellar biosynthesis protein FlhF